MTTREQAEQELLAAEQQLDRARTPYTEARKAYKIALERKHRATIALAALDASPRPQGPRNEVRGYRPGVKVGYPNAAERKP
jgi:hypothetical protein